MLSIARRTLICLLIAGVSVFAIACGDDEGSGNNGGGSGVDGSKMISELDADEQQALCDSYAGSAPDLTTDEVCLDAGNASAAQQYEQDNTADLEAACNATYQDGDCGFEINEDAECELPADCGATVDEYTTCQDILATALEDHYGSTVACADLTESDVQNYESFAIPTECTDLGEDCGY